MSGRPTAEQLRLRTARARRKRAVNRAMLAGAVEGAIVTGLLLAAGILIARLTGTMPGGFTTAIAVGAVTASAAIVAIARGVAVAMGRPIRDFMDPVPAKVNPPAASERPFGDRLEKYLEESPTPAVGAASSDKRRMAFFLSFFSGRRHAPKSPGAIREVLWRIHRLLHGNGQH